MGRGVGIAVDDIGQGTGVSGVGLDTLSLALGKGTPTACKRKCERARTPRGAVRANQLACLIGIQALRTSSRPPIMETVPKSRRYDRHPQQSSCHQVSTCSPRGDPDTTAPLPGRPRTQPARQDGVVRRRPAAQQGSAVHLRRPLRRRGDPQGGYADVIRAEKQVALRHPSSASHG